MKYKSLLLAVLLSALTIFQTALAANSLFAVCQDGKIFVEWSAASANELTLYRNGWPIDTVCVNSNSGQNRPGKYSVRLTTDEGCVQTDVDECALTAQVSKSSSLAAQVIRQVNEERARYGLPALKEDAHLTQAASVRAMEIAQSFGHTRPDGSSWSTVSDRAFGENIAKGHNSADRVMAAWMSSEGHRANILRERFGSIGVCALEIDGVLYWVQLFGR